MGKTRIVNKPVGFGKGILDDDVRRQCGEGIDQVDDAASSTFALEA